MRDPHAELLHRAKQGRRGRRAADEDAHLASDRGGPRVTGEHGEHRRRAAEMADLAGGQHRPHRRRVEAREAAVLAAHRGHGPGVRPAVAVEHRQRPQVGAARVEPGLCDHAERMQIGAAVGVHDPLGPAGGAARVVDREQRGLVGRRRDRDRLGARQPLVVVGALLGARAGHDHERRLGQRDHGLGDGGREARVRNEHAGAAVLEDVGELRRADADVDRHEHRARRGHREVQLEHLGDVGQEDRHPVARSHAPSAEPAGGPRAPVGELGIGDAPAVPPHRRPTAPHVARVQEQAERAQGRVGCEGLHEPAERSYRAAAAAAASSFAGTPVSIAAAKASVRSPAR